MGISSEDTFKTNKLLIDEDRVPFQDSFFDHVFLIHYLENSYNKQLSLREIWRILAPEGKLYIIIPNKNHRGIYLAKVHFIWERFFKTRLAIY